MTAPLAELITITATDGLHLPALHYRPATSGRAVVLWLHGMGSSGVLYNPTHTNALAQAFTSRGIAFLALQNRGGGMLQGIRYLDEAGDKQKRLQGTTHELIAECVHDVNGMLEWAKTQGYTSLILGGHSTGANKTVLYNFLEPQNPFAGFIVYGGGDDIGLNYATLGPERYHAALKAARQALAEGKGEELAPLDLTGEYSSYQSLADIMDPDGAYNIFPYYEAQNGQIGTKPLWQEFRALAKPTLVVYGEQDEYALPTTAAAVAVLKQHALADAQVTYKLIPGGDHSCFRHETEMAEVMGEWAAAHVQSK